ncbi:MAG: T9SS type A sorting domain-containing protein, partial [Ignavibacteria bacterium]|nr:T9SS type A sorting domain-containing protein [Ignavibacteria bacterium]
YPNPFNPKTNIKFSIPNSGFVSIKVYDAVGKEIKELVGEYRGAGNHVVTFDGINVSSGVYFYRIETNGFTDTKKMILMK